MKVRELSERLKECNPDATVVCAIRQWNKAWSIAVEEVFDAHIGHGEICLVTSLPEGMYTSRRSA